MLKTALFWLNCGIAVVPLYRRSKVPAVAWGRYREHLPTQDMAREWFSQPRNLALVSGWNGLVILDFDSPESYASFFVWHLEHDASVLDTYRVQSNRGIHLYYYLACPITAGIPDAPFEIKTGGRLVTAAPSIHESGRKYTALDDPTNIRTVKPEQILTYAPVMLRQPRLNLAPSPLNPEFESLDELKRSVSILSFFDAPRKRSDRFYITDCPFHGHKNNFWLDTEKNIGGCWKGCGNFDVISLTARLHNTSNGEAIKYLRKGY